MSDEQKEQSPKLVLGDIEPGVPLKIRLDGSKPGTTGESNYGTWCLWFGHIENFRVHEGRDKKTEKIIEGYSGKIIFFPPHRLSIEIEKMADGNDAVEIEITAKLEKSNKGSAYFKKYYLKKLTGGTPDSSSLTPSETKLIEDTLGLIKDGYNVSIEIFMKASQEPQYGGNITEERATELFKHLK